MRDDRYKASLEKIWNTFEGNYNSERVLSIVAADGGDARRITTSPLPEFKERIWARARYVNFPSEIDDYTLHARILEPGDLDKNRKYPVLFGPMYSNTVRNRWAGVYSVIQQLMVQKGYIVVQLDMRGSTGYGRAFREEFLMDFAGDDIEDFAPGATHAWSREPYYSRYLFGKLLEHFDRFLTPTDNLKSDNAQTR